MNPRLRFSVELRRQVVEQLLSGDSSVALNGVDGCGCRAGTPDTTNIFTGVLVGFPLLLAKFLRP